MAKHRRDCIHSEASPASWVDEEKRESLGGGGCETKNISYMFLELPLIYIGLHIRDRPHGVAEALACLQILLDEQTPDPWSGTVDGTQPVTGSFEFPDCKVRRGVGQILGFRSPRPGESVNVVQGIIPPAHLVGEFLQILAQYLMFDPSGFATCIARDVVHQ